MINDYTKSSYSNSETQQLDFYVNTLQPLFLVYEQELSYKLLHPAELAKGQRLGIDTKALFEMDNQTKANVYSTYVQNFIMTPNEVREALKLPYVEGGDKLEEMEMIQHRKLNQYEEGGENRKDRVVQNKGEKTGYFEVKAQGDTKAELTIYGEITSDKWWEEDVTPTEIKELLDSVKDKRHLYKAYIYKLSWRKCLWGYLFIIC